MANGKNRHTDLAALPERIREWGRELGFQGVGIASIDLGAAEARLLDWLTAGFHGEMEYMERHGTKRSRPPELVPGTVSVISARMDYMPDGETDPWAVLGDGELGYISRYALGRDYHKVLRKRLKRLAGRIEEVAGEFGHRVFTDSAPVLEKPLAAQAGLGWQGKHTNLLHRDAGSWFFLGEIYIDLPLAPDEPVSNHCGSCHACIDACPTGAIVAPYKLDARLCISYLTIELKGSIPVELRPLIGNRIFGCDDCQLVCPWNRFAQKTAEGDFQPRAGLEAPQLVALFGWDEQTFLERTEGSAMRRLGYGRWLRNVAVALGNAPTGAAVIAALESRRDHPDTVVREHVRWALARHNTN